MFLASVVCDFEIRDRSLQAAKLQTGVCAKYGKDNGNIKNNCADDNSGSNIMNYENDSCGGLVPLKGYEDVVNRADKEQNLQKCNSSLPMKREETTCASRASIVSKIILPQWMAPEVLRNEPSNEK